jgi:hypothetical protein
MKPESQEVRRLIYTSADDLRMQIRYYESTGQSPDMAVLEEAHQACVAQGMKTKAGHLRSFIRRRQKECK